jgi:pyruvate formate lyase activating enzyme
MPVAEARAAYWHAEPDGSVVCELCPHGCRIAQGKSGLCRARRNEGGNLALPYYGLVSSLAVDPIEKKPLHHFMPGSSVFSAGFVGCNMRCPFCQNWQISQELPTELEALTPDALVGAALRSGSPSIAYTYSEPCIHFEFVLAAMSAARKAGLKNVLVTNGCLNPEPARELLELTDAVNVDLKTWSTESYAKTLGGDRDTVLEFIRIASSLSSLEVTTLVVPSISDSREGIAAISEFLASLSIDLPLHLSAYHPAWRHAVPPVPPELVSELRDVARARLRFAYIGNLAGVGCDTICPNCGATVVSRSGYRIGLSGMHSNGSSATCAACGTKLPIIIK